MGFKTARPLVFRRRDKDEENFLVIMHYLAMRLWAKDCCTEAMRALLALLTSVSDGQARPSDAGDDLPEH
jgi:hypothetical protein